MRPRAGAPAPHGSSAERHLHAPAQPCGTRPSKASPHPLSILCTARPFSGAQSTVGALSFAFPSPWPKIRGPAWALVPAQLRSTPLSSGAIITGRHEAGDKPRNSPQPFLMGQLEPSPRKKKERLWLEQGASRAATHTALGRKPTGSPFSGRIPPQCLLSSTQHLSPAPALNPSAARQGLLAHKGQGGS